MRNPFLLRNTGNKRAYLYKLTLQGLTEKAALAVALCFLGRKEEERQALRAEIGQAPAHEQHRQGH